jgi:hypothetical protein
MKNMRVLGRVSLLRFARLACSTSRVGLVSVKWPVSLQTHQANTHLLGDETKAAGEGGESISSLA